MRFTVVTPSLNKAQFVSETLESVLSQEGDFELEYFVCDGGSTDGTVELLRRAEREFQEGKWKGRNRGISFSWSSAPDGGQAAAINAGLRRATGTAACYLNADDLLYPHALSHAAEAFRAYPAADFIHGDGDVIDQCGALQWEWLSRPFSHSVMTGYHYLWNDFTNYILQQAVFWRTRVHERIGFFDESFHYAMDVEYWVRGSSHHLRFKHVPKKLAAFRLIPGTKSLSGPTVFWPDYIEIIRRYRPGRSLALPLAFYYFNRARCCGFDLAAAFSDEECIRWRWQNLTEKERGRREADRQRAMTLAHFLIALELECKDRHTEAAEIFRAGRKRRPRSFAALFPGAAYLLRRIAGPHWGRRAEAAFHSAVRAYRRMRYDYRYASRG
jgi:glycosyltransferase involved in cell wall biosynthesis